MQAAARSTKSDRGNICIALWLPTFQLVEHWPKRPIMCQRPCEQCLYYSAFLLPSCFNCYYEAMFYVIS